MSQSLLITWPVIILLVYIVGIALVFYALILFIRLAKRGIVALDIYINEKRGGGRE